MNIHEYQAKELMTKFGVANPPGGVAGTAEEALQVARSLNTKDLVVKAQIHAGGRGKGTFTNGFKGGVKLCTTAEEAGELAGKMLGQTLVTAQTGEAGKLVSKVLVAQSKDIARELYFAIVLDREAQAPVVIVSQRGGVNIEEVAEHHPEDIMRLRVDPALGLQPYEARKLAEALDLKGDLLKPAVKIMSALYTCFIETDCSLVEVNPLVVTKGNEVMALDAKFNFDDNALFRHPDILAYRDITEEDPREVEASKFGLNYIGLDGNIACLVNGAGLAMGTMDIIQYAGGKPANFLDVGGGGERAAGDRGVQDSRRGQEREGDPGQHFRRHHEVRHDRAGHHQRGQGCLAAGAAGRAPRGHQRGRGQEVAPGIEPADHRGGRLG